MLGFLSRYAACNLRVFPSNPADGGAAKRREEEEDVCSVGQKRRKQVSTWELIKKTGKIMQITEDTGD